MKTISAKEAIRHGGVYYWYLWKAYSADNSRRIPLVFGDITHSGEKKVYESID